MRQSGSLPHDAQAAKMINPPTDHLGQKPLDHQGTTDSSQDRGFTDSRVLASGVLSWQMRKTTGQS